MAKQLDANLYVSGDPNAARATVENVLQGGGFQFVWNPDGWSGKATKGNFVLNCLLGALAQYHEIHVTFTSMPDGNLQLHVRRAGSGMAGGLWGMSKVKKSFNEVVQSLQAAYQQSGTLAGVDDQ